MWGGWLESGQGRMVAGVWRLGGRLEERGGCGLEDEGRGGEVRGGRLSWAGCDRDPLGRTRHPNRQDGEREGGGRRGVDVLWAGEEAKGGVR